MTCYATHREFHWCKRSGCSAWRCGSAEAAAVVAAVAVAEASAVVAVARDTPSWFERRAERPRLRKRPHCVR